MTRSLERDLAVLQLDRLVGRRALRAAHRQTERRLLRLTAAGPLRFYRNDLLKQAGAAYRHLCAALGAGSAAAATEKAARPTLHAGNVAQVSFDYSYGRQVVRRSGVGAGRAYRSIVAREAARRGGAVETRTPVNSAVKTAGILAGHQRPVAGRTVAHWRDRTPPAAEPAAGRLSSSATSNEAARTPRAQALIEDEFCKEVIYRLEGDLIRFDSRLALLSIADELRVTRFRAAMLIAQIVEAVRRQLRSA